MNADKNIRERELMKKKLISILSAAVILANVNILPVLAAEIDPAKEAVYQEYKTDEQYQMMAAEYGEAYADAFLENVVESRNAVMPRGGGGNECYQHVTNIKQTKTYNCGSTTTLQTLYGLNSASAVTGSTDTAKIGTLDKEYNVDSQGSMMVYQVVNALNKYNKGNQKYIYAAASNMTIDQFENNIANSLTGCKPVILHAKTNYLSYYGGKSSGHYISLDYVNRTTDKVRLVDCNYNSSYYGVHQVPLSEAYNSIHAESGRYLIY